MAVESFLQPGEAKLTVEKTVKQKPSLSDLTTIEEPGRPIGADIMEEQEQQVVKKPRKKSTPKKEASGNETVIITEKPQAAMKIASALGTPRMYAENNVSYYELSRNNQKIIVVSAVGHLFNLTYAKDQHGWPIFKTEWEPSFKRSAFTKRYYDVIKKLSSRAKDIVVATDYDIEGEVIGWNIVRFLMHRKDAQRMKFSTLTKPELEKSFDSRLPTLDWGQAYAGETRHHIDWLYGINLSRALMAAIKTTGAFRILSIGRIQGPALKIIVDREREINTFKSEPYWNVLALVNGIEYKHPEDIFDKKQLDKFKNIKEANAKTSDKEENILPPHPFDLTTLQREAYAWHKISPARTLQLAQSLYLDGIISYPRTSSQKIPKEINPREILKKLEKKFPQAKKATRNLPVEGAKTDPAHPSIYPTGEIKHLQEDEEKLYELIVKRFISAFSSDALLSRRRTTLTSGDITFTASGMKMLEPGWSAVYPSTMEEREIPVLNGPIKIDEIKIVDKETQPPKRYTPASLITLLEKNNLGTKTTRSLIIETLFQRGYLDGTSIKATPLGMRLIEALEKHSPIIIDDQLTRDLEEKMEDIQLGTGDRADKEAKVIKNVEEIIEKISISFKEHLPEIGNALKEGSTELREQQKENSTIMPCPVCKQGNLVIKYAKKLRRYFAACDKYPECKTTYSLPPNAMIKRTDKTSPNGLPILIALRKGKKPWEFEFNPNYKKEQESDEKNN